jgi:hypothetical protein
MLGLRKKPLAVGLLAPFQADSVAGPEVVYREAMTAVYCPTEEGRSCRVTFEKLDSLRINRGEYCPYPCDTAPGAARWAWAWTVKHSPWLRERYEYETEHYRHAYEFGGDVDEMLRDYSHYVLTFHDEFVEAIAAGIWFECADGAFDEHGIGGGHPLAGLGEETMVERREVSRITYQIRRNPASLDELVTNARYCSQPLLAFAAELDGRATVYWTLNLRATADRPLRSVLSRAFGGRPLEFDGVAGLDEALPHVEQWVAEVRQRRDEMGRE